MSEIRFPNNVKVCHVTSVHNRYDVRIFHKECKSLVKYGFNVTLLVNDDMEDEFKDGVYIKSTNYKPNNRFERMVISQRRIKKEAMKINADIYHFHDPELLPLASLVKKKGKKVIFDFHEDVAQQILYKDWIPKNARGIISNIYRLYETRRAKVFDALITVTPKFVERLKMINPNTYMVTNYPILKEFEARSEGKRNNSICFAGGIFPQWNHLNIIKAIEGIDDIDYIIAGNGTAEYLNSLKKLDGWEKVKYLGIIPHEQVKSIYSRSMIGIALLSHNTQVNNEGTLGNTKIFEYMEAALPIICSDNIIWKRIVDKYKCGIAVNPDNLEELKNAIVKLATNPELAWQMGDRGRRAVEQVFNWNTQERVLINLYNLLMGYIKA